MSPFIIQYELCTFDCPIHRTEVSTPEYWPEHDKPFTSIKETCQEDNTISGIKIERTKLYGWNSHGVDSHKKDAHILLKYGDFFTFWWLFFDMLWEDKSKTNFKF